MGKNNPTRRSVLQKSAGLVAGTGIVAGRGSASSETDDVDTGFDPNDFEQVDRFVKAVFDTDEDPYRLLEEWNETGEMDPVFSELTEEQAEAFVDAVRPSYVTHERVGLTHSRGRPHEELDASESPMETISRNPGTALRSRAVETAAIGEDPVEKWGWEEKDLHNRGRGSVSDNPPGHGGVQPGRRSSRPRPSSTSSTVGTSATTGSVDYSGSASYSYTISAYAASIDYTGYKWRAKTYWNYYYSGSIDNVDTADTVLHTNFAVTYEGTDISTVERDEYFDAHFQAHFDNDLGEICVSYYLGEACVDLKQSFHPYVTLRGDGRGSGTTVESGNDSIAP